MIDQTFIKETEDKYFRTDSDTGANANALMIWNLVRKKLGMERLNLKDLPAYCQTHEKYHKIDEEYGCVRKYKIGQYPKGNQNEIQISCQTRATQSNR